MSHKYNANLLVIGLAAATLAQQMLDTALALESRELGATRRSRVTKDAPSADCAVLYGKVRAAGGGEVKLEGLAALKMQVHFGMPGLLGKR